MRLSVSTSTRLACGAARLLLLLLGLCAGCSSDSSPPPPDQGGSKDLPPLKNDIALDRAVTTDKTPVQDRSAPDEAKPEYLLLSNASEKCNAALLKPDKGEEGYWCAARLTPPAYPFMVKDLRYRLGHGPDSKSGVECNAGLAHRVELYVSDGLIPPATPTPVYTLDMPAVDPSTIDPETGRQLLEKLDPLVKLTQGQHLFVAIKLVGKHPEVLCVPINAEEPYEGSRNYWSSAATPPYSWVKLDTFGLTGSILISAAGYVEW